MNVGDVVTLTDATGENTGKVTQLLQEPGMVRVTWDSGVSERVHESELKKKTEAPSLVGRTLAPRPGDDAYEDDDPKHPTFRERLAALWDNRFGK